MLGRASPHDLGEARYTYGHQFASRTLLGLFFSKRAISDSLHRKLQRARVLATVVLPSQRRLVSELVGLEQILKSNLRGLHTDFMSHDIGQSLDGVHGFGDAKRAPVGDSARWLVGVRAVYFDVRSLQIIGAGANVKEPGGKLRWIRGGISITVIG